MDPKVKEKVDAFWEWYGKRPQSGLLKSQSIDEEQLRVWCEEENRWDLQTLLFHIDVVCPTLLLETIEHLPKRPTDGDYSHWHIGAELPVPSTLFEDFSDRVAETYGKWFDYRAEDVYQEMAKDFRFLNFKFENGLSSILIELLNSTQVNTGLLLMAIGNVLGEEERKAEQLSKPRKLETKKLLANIEAEKDEVHRAVDIFKKCLDLADNHAKLNSDVYENVGRWMKRRISIDAFRTFLDAMKAEAKTSAADAILGYKGVSEIFMAGLPSREYETTEKTKRGVVAMWKAFTDTKKSKFASSALIYDMFETVGLKLVDSVGKKDNVIRAMNTKLNRWSEEIKD